MPLANVVIARETTLGESITHDDTLLRPDDILEDRSRKIRSGHLPIEQTYRDRVAGRGGFCLNSLFIAPRTNQQSPLCPRVLDREHHQCLDQLLRNNLAGYCQRYLDHRSKI